MPVQLPDIPAVERQIVDLTNAYRAKNRLSTVRENAILSAAARAFAAYLARTNTFSHTADGREPSARVSAQGYAWCQVRENLALQLDSRGFETRAMAAEAMDGWIKSPGHNANLLASAVTEIGVGVVRAPGGPPKYLSVQLFARPASLNYDFKIVNATPEQVRFNFAERPEVLQPRYSVKFRTCSPEKLLFESIGKGGAARKLSLSYDVTGGATYTVRPKATTVEVTITPLAGSKSAPPAPPASAAGTPQHKSLLDD